MVKDNVGASEGSWSRLPDEIGEGMLSLLPLPALCMCRSVCKKWNELLRKPHFLDLCDLNGRINQKYLCVTRHKTSPVWSQVDDIYRQTMCFLDLTERRWYSIPTDASSLAPTKGNIAQLLAMHDGLICELSTLRDNKDKFKIVMLDPVAKSRRELPTSITYDGIPTPVTCLDGDFLPTITTTVDITSLTFKVFLMNDRLWQSHYSRVSVYESSTGAWRGLPNPPERLGTSQFTGVFEASSVFFQGNLYTIFWHSESQAVLVFSYNVDENLWREVLAEHNLNPGYPQLVVNGHRLFMGLWSNAPLQLLPLIGQDHDETMFEIKEILVDVESSSRLVAQISSQGITQMFGEPHWNDLQFALTDGFPVMSHSVVLISGSSGKPMTYDVWSRSFGALPAPHPLQRASLQLQEEWESNEDDEPEDGIEWWPLYPARLMNLSLRNIL